MTERRKVFGKKKMPHFESIEIEENMSYTEYGVDTEREIAEGTWPGSAIWKPNNTPAGSTVSTFNEYEDSYGWGGPNHIEKEVKVQNKNLENVEEPRQLELFTEYGKKVLDFHEVIIDYRSHIYYSTVQNTWWFSDETSQLNGPFISYNIAAKNLEEYYDKNIGPGMSPGSATRRRGPRE